MPERRNEVSPPSYCRSGEQRERVPKLCPKERRLLPPHVT
jgi:hypothetical protein